MFLSSDTNIWLDFESIGHLDHPFQLDNEYHISNVTYHDELRHSEMIQNIVEKDYLHIAEVTVDEMNIANIYADKYPRISFQDGLALAVAKSRNWTLLTGDSSLRKASNEEDVEVHGTLWIYDELHRNKLLPNLDILNALESLLAYAENGRRLPKDEIKRRITELLNENEK